MKRNLKVSLIIGTLIIICVIGLSLFILNMSSPINNNLIKTIRDNIPFIGNDDNIARDSGIIGTSSTGGSGTGGGGGVEGVTGTTQNCQNVQITYSLGTLPTSEICNNYQDETCVEKQVFCYVDVRNLDSIDGTFDISFIFHEKANVGNVFASNNESIFVASSDNELLSSSRFFTGSEANQNISCATATNSVPVKQVCS